MADNNGRGRADSAFPPITLPFTLEALIEFNRPALAALAKMNGKVYDGIAAMNKNWAAFVNRRLKEDLAVPQQLAGCKTVQDIEGEFFDFKRISRQIPSGFDLSNPVVEVFGLCRRCSAKT